MSLSVSGQPWCELGLWADDRIELLPDLARYRAGPTGADLAHIDKVLAFLLAEVKRGNARRICHEPNDSELALLDSLDFQPAFIALRAIWSVDSL